jgi:hypothetical protein
MKKIKMNYKNIIMIIAPTLDGAKKDKING